MNPRELIALARRHLVAVTIVVLLAAGIAYKFKHTPPTYQESATIVLTAPGAVVTDNDSLVTTGGIVARWIMGPQGQQEVRQAGAIDDFNVALVNAYNQEFPFYPYPLVTVSVTAQDPIGAQRTFAIVTRVFDGNLSARQAEQGVLASHRITAYSIGDTGPVIAPGSPKRTFAGLVPLTIVAAFLVSTFLDRHPIRPRDLLRGRRHSTRDPVAGDGFVARASRRRPSSATMRRA